MGNKKRPEVFQGNLKKKRYFEGWYHKIVDPSEKFIYAFIPAIALNKKEGTSHAFIQFLDGINAKTEYFKYPIEEFENCSYKDYKIHIEKNSFSSSGFKVNIDQNNRRIEGEIRNLNPIPWPKKFLQPGVMGWFSYMPFMETYHGIVSMNHSLQGSLKIDDKDISFNGGKGYIEKDWGKSFPSAWIWTQSNHFKNPSLSFMFSIAKIPFLGGKFNGFLSAIWYENEFYKFATYTRAKVRLLDLKKDSIEIIVEDKKYRLEFAIIKKGTKFGDLKAPSGGIMIAHCPESINSTIKLRLFDMKKDQLIINDIGENAGLEITNPDVLKPK